MDRLDCIKTFCTVVEKGNFSLAAREMKISRDLVAKRIAYLEYHLQATLFIRTTRKMNLTMTGEKFYQHSKIISTEFDWAKQEINNEHFYPEGELKINAPLSFTENILTPIFSKFICQYPDIKIDLALSDHFIDIYENQYDLTLRVDETPIDAFENIVISQHLRGFYATPKYLSERGNISNMNDLFALNILIYSQNTDSNKIQLTRQGQPTYLQVFPKFCCNNGSVLVDLALDHHGIIYLPDFLVEKYVKNGQLVACLEEYRSPPLHFYVACPSRQKLAIKSRLFINFLCDHLHVK